jgi:hypothetical protein
MSTRYCSTCGQPLSPGFTFCPSCSARVVTSTMPIEEARSTAVAGPPPSLPPPTQSVAPSSAPPPPSSVPPPPPYAISLAQSAPESKAKGRRVAASSLVLIAAVLLTVAMFVPWWGLTLSGGGATVSVNFLPGSSYSGSGTYNGITFSSSASYTSANLSRVGFLYEAVLGLGLTAAFLAFVGMGLGYASAYGTSRSRRPVGLADDLTGGSFMLAVLLPFLILFAQPWAYNNDASSAGASCGGGSNPCNSFWGSATSDGVTGTFGPGVGWYLAILAVILLLVAAILFWASQPRLYTRDELVGTPPQAAVPQSYPAGPLPPPYAQNFAGQAQLSTYTPGSNSVAASVPVASSPAVPNCPRCGTSLTYVAQYSRYYCWTCRAYS